MTTASATRFRVADVPALPGVPCPCGTARRAFGDVPGGVATLHQTTISADSRTHYHRRMTELYYVLEGEGTMELDDERVPLRPGISVYIAPQCRHRAVGDLKVMIVAIPQFDPEDEYFD
ncbi:cupin domain-containing protein [Acuticoccus sp. MNP-M23]|uniref:cupin domain-containing protein n=1 Tax=Acuticoccus sp. MNP-M23 TaxID=3072793 RepID=UPI002815A040|nr:cupin domain-containing protein [Acuticoccus sp. MNP-M23]WMS43725.1 cupin domain-containing protein [Acuticoccus sp. MNP-M23]